MPSIRIVNAANVLPEETLSKLSYGSATSERRASMVPNTVELFYRQHVGVLAQHIHTSVKQKQKKKKSGPYLVITDEI